MRDYVRDLRGISFDAEVNPVQAHQMEGGEKYMLITPPRYYDLQSLDTIGSLIHWKVLLLVAKSLSPEQRSMWKGDRSPMETSLVPSEAAAIPEPVFSIDSHFHLDMTLAALGFPPSGRLGDVARATTVDERRRLLLRVQWRFITTQAPTCL